MSWRTVPICEMCWREEEGSRDPVRVTLDLAELELCYRCGCPLNRSVIYVRRDISTEPPTHTDPEETIMQRFIIEIESDNVLTRNDIRHVFENAYPHTTHRLIVTDPDGNRREYVQVQRRDFPGQSPVLRMRDEQ